MRSKIAIATQLATTPLPPNDEQRKREPLRRQHAHVDADVDERLHAEPDADALRGQRGERPLQARGLASDAVRAEQDPHEERDDHGDAREPQLLGDYRQQEVGVCFGQEQQLLHRRSQSDAEPFAAPERDQRMRKLVTLAERIGPRIEERGEPLHAIRRRNQDRRQGKGQQQREADEQPPVEPAEEQDAEGDRHDDHERAEVGLEQQQSAGDDHDREQRQETAQDRVLERLLRMQERRAPHGVARRVQHDRELHELRRLHVDHAERQPAARSVDRLAHVRNEHEHEQHGARDEEVRRELLPGAKRDLERD